MSTSQNWEEALRNRVRPYRGKEVTGNSLSVIASLSLSNLLLDYNPNMLMGKYEFGNWENCGISANRRLCSSFSVLDEEISLCHLRPKSWPSRSFIRLSKLQIAGELAGNGQRCETLWEACRRGWGPEQNHMHFLWPNIKPKIFPWSKAWMRKTENLGPKGPRNSVLWKKFIMGKSRKFLENI